MSNKLFVLISLLLIWTGCSSDPASTPSNNDDNNGEADMSTAPDEGGGVDANPCEPTDEVCDGEDNDCDGEVDEDFDVDTTCSVGLGACASEGVTVCNSAGDGVECDAEAHEPAAEELCGDDIDNDCDGAIDEDFNLGDPCTMGVGVCEVTGMLVCDVDTGTEVCDAIPLDPPEDPDEMTCDALDNDCDGEVDEGCDDDQDGFCDAALTLVSPDGDAGCMNGDGDCDDDDAEVYPGAPGLCDGKDNDCVDGVDDIKRRSAVAYTVPATYVDPSPANSPIQAIATPTGFCYFIQPPNDQVDGVEGFVNRTDNVAVNRPGLAGEAYQTADIEWGGGWCGALLVVDDGDATRSARLYSWTPDYSASAQNNIVNDDISHIAPSWDATLAFANDTWVVGWSDTAGSTGSYATLPVGFNFTTPPSAPLTVGNNGTFPELGLHPSGQGFLFMSNFFNINVREFQVGMAATTASLLEIPNSVNRSSMAMNTLNGQTWVALRNDGTVDAWEIRRVSTALMYDVFGEVPYLSAVEPQDYITRNPFVGGPAGALWFLDTVDEEVAAIAENGAGGLDVTKISDPAATGQLIAARQASADVTELLWLTDPGSTTAGPQIEIAEYTCH